MTEVMNSASTKCINKIEFWNSKIIEWEKNRYSKRVHSIISGSVNNRMLIAFNMLKHCSRDLVVVEAGCGTARLMPLLLESGVRKYIGIDFSPCAIEAARERAKELGVFSRIDLIQEDITKLKMIKADLCFSLGLFDWLTDQEICFLLNNIKTRYYLHSFSEKRMNIQQALHRIALFGEHLAQRRAAEREHFLVAQNQRHHGALQVVLDGLDQILDSGDFARVHAPAAQPFGERFPEAGVG